MPAIDVEALLREVSADKPCGDDLEYDPAFGEMQRTAQGKPEQQFGDTIIPAEEPDWRSVKSQGVDLLKRSKDLRVTALLMRALLRDSGINGFSEGMQLLRGLTDKFWDHIHPKLDPDDGLDPTMRLNIISTLCDADTILRPLREAPLVSSRVLGKFGLRDIAIAKGDQPAPEGMETLPKTSSIDAAFQEVPLGDLEAIYKSLGAALESADAIESTITSKVGASRAMSLDPLRAVLKAAHAEANERLTRRGSTVAAPGSAAGGSGGAAGAGSVGGSAAGSGGAPMQVTGEVASREDVIRLLDKICEYYVRFEPSSPVPVLLLRAKRLVSRNFLEIVGDLLPDSVAQAQFYQGIDTSKPPE